MISSRRSKIGAPSGPRRIRRGPRRGDHHARHQTPNGTRATFTETFVPKRLVMRLILPLFMGTIRRGLREYYAAIKTKVESGG